MSIRAESIDIVIDRTYAVGVFAFGRAVLKFLLVFGFSAPSAEKPNTENRKYHAAAGGICSKRGRPLTDS
jgi:hypothetical protein